MNKFKLQAENLMVDSFHTIPEPTGSRDTVKEPQGCICFAPPCICSAGPDCTGTPPV